MSTLGNKSSFVFESRLPEVLATLDSTYNRNLTAAIKVWQASIRRVLAGQRTGKQYRVPGTQVFYTASREGEAPANRLGALRASYLTEVSAASLAAYLGSELDYSLHMERGTKHIKPRPAIEPAFRAKQAEIIAELSRPV